MLIDTIMGLFAALGSKLNGAVNWIGSKSKGIAKTVGGKLSHYGDIVASVAEKAAPVLASVGLPEAGAFAATVGGIAKGASTAGHILSDYGNGGRVVVI